MLPCFWLAPTTATVRGEKKQPSRCRRFGAYLIADGKPGEWVIMTIEGCACAGEGGASVASTMTDGPDLSSRFEINITHFLFDPRWAAIYLKTGFAEARPRSGSKGVRHPLSLIPISTTSPLRNRFHSRHPSRFIRVTLSGHLLSPLWHTGGQAQRLSGICPADDRRLRDQRNGLHRAVHFRDQTPQCEMVVTRTVESERQNWHIID